MLKNGQTYFKSLGVLTQFFNIMYERAKCLLISDLTIDVKKQTNVAATVTVDRTK